MNLDIKGQGVGVSVWSFIGVLLVQVMVGFQAAMFLLFYFSAQHHPTLTPVASQGLTILFMSYAGSLAVSVLVAIYRYMSASAHMSYPIFYLSWGLLATLLVYWLVVRTFYHV